MNASLVLLLLVFHFTCHGKEQTSSNPSGILPKTNWQKKVETPLEVSCPDPTDIEPCECTIEEDGLAMFCLNMQDEEQLRKVFSAFFPTTEFYRFSMYQNIGVKVLEDGVFGNVSFQILDIFYGLIETVEIGALTPSLSTLTILSISFCMLETFPFEVLPQLPSLQQLRLDVNKIHTVPPLSSSSLEILYLDSNRITRLTPDIFTLLPAVKEIYLNGNQLTEIPTGTFTGLPKLEFVNLLSNDISYLQSLTFDLVYSPDHTTVLHLFGNNIEYVEVDAFKGVAANTSIEIRYNALTKLPEEVWRPVLEKSITVNFEGNDLACGCDVAWLVRDPLLLTMASNARCADGTLLTDLNPVDFDTCS